jgi:glutathione synthase/RimK-type ligase-like ATP-grasp enzyme
MKKALILNNTHSETEFINILKKFYGRIYTIGKSKPYNKSVKIQHIKWDYKDYKKIKVIKKKYNISDIFPGANDFTLLSLAHLKSKIIDSLSVIKILHNKELFRSFNKSIKTYNLNSIKKKNLKQINYPLIAKPKVGHGGNGIVKIENFENLKFYLINYKNEYIVEDFIDGSNHGIFTLIKNQKIIFLFFDTEQRFLNPYTVSSTTSNCDIINNIKKKIKKKISRIVKKLKLKDGILHCQIIFNKQKKKFYIIEVTRRIPGDNYLRFIKYSTGIDVADCIFKLFKKKKINVTLFKKKNILRKVLMAKKNGYFNKINISKIISDNVIKKIIFYKKNQKIKNYLQERIGVVFFKFKTKEEMIIKTRNIDMYIEVLTK